jgi:aspartyl protease family protein
LKLEGARTLTFRTANGLIQAPVVRVPSIALQGAKAENVEVAVLSTLPPDVDGLLGLGFLARFEMKLDARAGRLELSARKR